jgi:hypothetical protein
VVKFNLQCNKVQSIKQLQKKANIGDWRKNIEKEEFEMQL